MLKKHEGPIYTCELDSRCPGLVEYPIKEVVEETNCHYLNNTVAYAIAFAFWHKVKAIHLFGIDFGYKGNLYFAEAGRACCEYWLALCMKEGIEVGVAASSYLLDTAVKEDEKLYGYHRLADPLVTHYDVEDKKLVVKKVSEVNKPMPMPEPTLVGRNEDQKITVNEIAENSTIEPKKW